MVLITVCDKCFKASCWQGKFICKDAIVAGAVKLSKKKLRILNREHECYWKTDKELGNKK